MKQLTLVRHAKSDWNNKLSDHDRPLNKRGVKSAVEAGQYLVNKGFKVEKIYCSSAERAQATLAYIQQSFMPIIPFEIDKALYTFNVQALLQYIYNLDNKLNAVALVGHNPAMTELTNILSNTIVAENLPTCGIVELQLNITDWHHIDAVPANKVSLYTPKNKSQNIF